ncbi:RteC protein [Flavobacterium fluvii]|uniref:RteC protein n=1 Tax=Flavobacterium fluvii TaxID=468056 RepID=A0A1M5FDS8_9FLAO|nr:RteC domain-containing protein [Flavobacterium fluvii]SHF89677.1 RteC protein [Flavobacterium fluvii]
MSIKIKFTWGTSKDYIENYQKKLEEHIAEYEDNCELTFIDEQLWYYSHTMRAFEYNFYDNSHLTENEKKDRIVMTELLEGGLTDNQELDWEKTGISTLKIIQFLENRKQELESDPTTSTNEPQQNENTLQWQGSTLEFAEFTKALIESGFIGKVKNEKEVFERMKQFFNVDDFDKSDKLKQVRKRTKEPTPVINTLETSLMNWIKRED